MVKIGWFNWRTENWRGRTSNWPVGFFYYFFFQPKTTSFRLKTNPKDSQTLSFHAWRLSMPHLTPNSLKSSSLKLSSSLPHSNSSSLSLKSWISLTLSTSLSLPHSHGLTRMPLKFFFSLLIIPLDVWSYED